MKRPTHCPHCGNQVEKVRPYKWRAPPDERDDYPMPVSMGSADDFPAPVNLDDVIDCMLMIPCGHLFREGDVLDRPADLSDRVMNPATPIDDWQ